MKAKFVSKFFFLFICLWAFASAVVAQEELKPIYVGEYQTSAKDLSAFEAMTEQLVLRLSREPLTTRGFVGVFEKSDFGEKVRTILSRYPKLKNQITYLNPAGRPRPLSEIEFWIVPQGAESPEPVWCGFCVCPTLNVNGVKYFESRVNYPTFSASVEGGSETEIKYTWKVSAGKIIEGQGTKTIKVDAEGAREIIATVEIEGICEECQREASFTTKIQ